MAVEIGTATGYKDLLAKLRTFLTGLAVNPWTSLRYTVGGGTNPDELILRAPGLAGTDQIYVGITTFENATADYFNWRLAGFTGYNAALAFGAQPGVMQKVHLTPGHHRGEGEHVLHDGLSGFHQPVSLAQSVSLSAHRGRQLGH
jgi:hypothetical protein